MKRVIFLLALLLGACSTAPQRTLPPVVDGTQPRTPQPEAADSVEVPDTVEVPVPPPAPSGGAVVALLDRADVYHQSGDIGNEAATIERALRIDPNNARLWNRLAAIRLDQGQPRQAEQLALKSNALSRGDRRLQAQNWRLVAKARWSVNDSAGARAAEKKARDLD
ncbi:MAG: tetratricopeptide repeat protein [Pseudomonadota bacterium]|nr:tetratricopeptide repeat protein [Pseudomonadota bacterium]